MAKRCLGLKGKDLQICRRNHQRIDELIKNTKDDWHKLLDKAYQSGAVSDHFKEDNYLLSKAVITVWCREEPYAPLAPSDKKEVKNLERFL
ncbi:unnamed protein product [marine sediment metagenome]|uniref:Uncharacterized protein n=1 Tax=marine sediment metagenome TaxID=412755 RepID=X0YN55_9ZZZZ